MLQGDTRNLPLANIFQTLALNQQDGVLSISHRGESRRLGLMGGRILLLAEEDHRSQLLPSILDRIDLLSPRQYHNVFAALPAPRPPGDVLLETHLLSKQELLSRVREHLLEKLFDTFRWVGARYRFEARPIRPASHLFSAPQITKELSLPVNSVLMEVARREDEWGRIQTAIPSLRIIHRFQGPLANAVEDDPNGLGAERLEQISKLFDGRRTIGEILETTKLPEFLVCSSLRVFLEKGLALELPAVEIRQLVESERHSVSPDRTCQLYRAILHKDPKDTEIRRKLFFALEKMGGPKSELALHARRLAVENANDPKAQREWLDRHLAADPHAVESLGDLLLMSTVQKREKDWRGLRRRFFQAVFTQKSFADACKYLERLIESRPSDTALLIDAASIYAEADRATEARDILVRAGDILAEHRDRPSLLKVYSKLKNLDPKAAQRLKRPLEQLERLGATGGRQSVLRPVLLSLTLVLLAGSVVAYEWTARRAYAETIDIARMSAERGDYESARGELRLFKQRFRWSFVAQTIPMSDAKLRSIAEAEAKSKADESSQTTIVNEPAQQSVDAETLLTAATAHQQRGDYADALTLFKKIDASSLSSTAGDFVGREIRRLETYFSEANALVERMRNAEQRGDWELANRLGSKVFDEYPHSPVAKSLRVPIVLKTVPEKWVEIRSESDVVEGSPLVVRTPAIGERVQIAAPGYKTVDIRLEPLTAWSIEIRLQRLAQLSMNAGVPIEAFASGTDDRVFFGARNGRVVAADTESGNILWEYSLPGIADVSQGIQRIGGLLVFPGTDGAIYAITTEGEERCRLEIPAEHGYAIRPLVKCGSAGVSFVVATNTGRLIRVDLASQTIAWSIDAGFVDIANLVSVTDSITVSNRAGMLCAFRMDDGERLWARNLEAPITSDLTSTARGSLVLTTERAILDLDARTGEGVEIGLNENCAGPMASGSDELFAVNERGQLLAMSMQNVVPKWRTELDASSKFGVQRFGRSLFVMSKAGTIFAVDATTGALKWVHRVETEPGAPLSIDESAVRFVGLDGRVVVIPQEKQT